MIPGGSCHTQDTGKNASIVLENPKGGEIRMNFKRYLLRRLLLAVVVMFGLSIVIFAISHILPGDVATMALGSTATEEAKENYRIANHLYDSLPRQYLYWMGGVLHGDFGTSTSTNRAVSTDVAQFLPATLELVIMAALMLVILSILLGVLAAKYRNTIVDVLVRVLSYIGVAMPSFVIATLLVLLFGHVWKVIPVLSRLSYGMTPPATVTGFYTIDALLAGNLAAFWDAFLHLLVPAFALALGGVCQEARIIRNSMTENASKDYLSAMRGYGVPEGKILRKYQLKPSLIPAVSCMGMDIASLMGNAFLVETIFNWPGISRYGLSSMLGKDLNAIAAVLLVFGGIAIGKFNYDNVTEVAS